MLSWVAHPKRAGLLIAVESLNVFFPSRNAFSRLLKTRLPTSAAFEIDFPAVGEGQMV